MSLSAEQITQLLEADQAGVSQAKLRREFYSRFDQAAVFLLDLRYDNLFEATRLPDKMARDWYFRCKGCDMIVTRPTMKDHHSKHKREYERIGSDS